MHVRDIATPRRINLPPSMPRIRPDLSVDFVSDKDVHRFFRILNQHVYRLKDESAYSYDPVKYVGKSVYRIFAHWDIATGRLGIDIIDDMIREICGSRCGMAALKRLFPTKIGHSQRTDIAPYRSSPKPTAIANADRKLATGCSARKGLHLPSDGYALNCL